MTQAGALSGFPIPEMGGFGVYGSGSSLPLPTHTTVVGALHPTSLPREGPHALHAGPLRLPGLHPQLQVPGELQIQRVPGERQS